MFTLYYNQQLSAALLNAENTKQPFYTAVGSLTMGLRDPKLGGSGVL